MELKWKPRWSLALAGACILLNLPVFAGQQYPERPVRLIVPYAPGGGTDVTARVIGAKLADAWGRPVIIDNRPGAGSNLGSSITAKASPDGYTLLMAGTANAVNMTLYSDPLHDVQRDFAAVIWCVQGFIVLATHPALPARNLGELIALAKTRPGQLNYATGGVGSGNHMAGELLRQMAQIDIAHVAYKGNAPSITDTMAGNVQMVFSGVPALYPHIKAGRLRGIAISSLNRVSAAKEIPTFNESGVKDYEAINWFGIVAPRKTPAPIISRLNADVNTTLADPSVHDTLDNKNGLVIKGGSSEDFERFIGSEIKKYGMIIKRSGIKPL